MVWKCFQLAVYWLGPYGAVFSRQYQSTRCDYRQSNIWLQTYNAWTSAVTDQTPVERRELQETCKIRVTKNKFNGSKNAIRFNAYIFSLLSKAVQFCLRRRSVLKFYSCSPFSSACSLYTEIKSTVTTARSVRGSYNTPRCERLLNTDMLTSLVYRQKWLAV